MILLIGQIVSCKNFFPQSNNNFISILFFFLLLNLVDSIYL